MKSSTERFTSRVETYAKYRPSYPVKVIELLRSDCGPTPARDYSKFQSVNGSAEATTLPAASVNLITAGQAFHWFDAAAARNEFVRILKANGFVALIWNDRRLDSSAFLRNYEALLREFGTDYAKVQEFDPANQITGFFAPCEFKYREFPNRQEFDFEGFKGRVLSASYTPEPNNPNFEPMLKALQKLFDSHHENGMVAFDYDTKVFYGQLS